MNCLLRTRSSATASEAGRIGLGKGHNTPTKHETGSRPTLPRGDRQRRSARFDLFRRRSLSIAQAACPSEIDGLGRTLLQQAAEWAQVNTIRSARSESTATLKPSVGGGGSRCRQRPALPGPPRRGHATPGSGTVSWRSMRQAFSSEQRPRYRPCGAPAVARSSTSRRSAGSSAPMPTPPITHRRERCGSSPRPRRQFAPDRIRVNSIHPGFVDTPMTRPGHSNPEVARLRLEATPLGRFGTPADIAAGCLYLASDEASWVTGGLYHA